MAAIDPEMVEELRDMLGADFGLFLETFLNDLHLRCDAIEAAVAAGDAEAVRHAAHSLKGSSSNLGAFGLSGACATLENSAVKGDLVSASVMTADILEQKKYVQQAVSALS